MNCTVDISIQNYFKGLRWFCENENGKRTVHDFEEVENGQEGLVVVEESSAGLLGTGGDQLEDLERGADDVRVARVEGAPQRRNDDGQQRRHAVRRARDQLLGAFARQKLVRVLRLAQAVQEQRQVVVVVQRVHLHLREIWKFVRNLTEIRFQINRERERASHLRWFVIGKATSFRLIVKTSLC